jgi:hypothetical protein
MAKKSTCPISRAEFNKSAQTLIIKVGDREFKAVPKNFSTGSLGWNVNEKMTVNIGGTDVTVQVGMNLTIVGSKDLPPDSDTPKPAPAPESGTDAQ